MAADEALSAASAAACRTLANELTESRFPSPRLLAFKVGYIIAEGKTISKSVFLKLVMV